MAETHVEMPIEGEELLPASEYPQEKKKKKKKTFSFAERVGKLLKWMDRAFSNTTLNEWGRYTAITASVLLFFSGIIGCFYDDPLTTPVGAYSIVVGALLFPLVWPIILPHPILQKPLLVTQHYGAFGTLLMVLSCFAFFSFPTHMGAICLAYAGFIYIISALKDEKPRDLEGIRRLSQARKRKKPASKGKK
eukprot:CAMPEP_0119133514 /NCGR_PEP_ID=MMETSP1310-20130426/13409_1 /TAXON_ID=464262 /ORGANISM="Genus nov. species nov., Strain RCC2339" /LENGTH=191 /DNA_ID=CAMNT_0007124207 /DNA_START=62 /DNA_END=637 /DNA_ORIENTATION=+